MTVCRKGIIWSKIQSASVSWLCGSIACELDQDISVLWNPVSSHGNKSKKTSPRPATLLVLETVAVLSTLSECFETWARVTAVIVTAKRSLTAERGFVLLFVSHRCSRGSQFTQPETHPHHDLSPDRSIRPEWVFRVFGGIVLGNESRSRLSQMLLWRKAYKKDLGTLKKLGNWVKCFPHHHEGLSLGYQYWCKIWVPTPLISAGEEVEDVEKPIDWPDSWNPRAPDSVRDPER